MSEVVMSKPHRFSAPVYRGPLGTALPTDATTELNAAFKSIGSISEDGLSETITRDSEEIKRWGGDVVQIVQTGKTDTFSFSVIDYLNIERQKLTFGDKNVTGTSIDTGLTVKSTTDDLGAHAYVIDEILTGDVLQRTVIKEAKVTEVGELKRDNSGVLSQEVILTAVADDDGVTFTRYIKRNLPN